MFPKILNFKSDDTQIKFQKQVVENKIVYGVYIYTKAKEFFGTEIKYTKDRIEELLRKEIATT